MLTVEWKTVCGYADEQMAVPLSSFEFSFKFLFGSMQWFDFINFFGRHPAQRCTACMFKTNQVGMALGFDSRK